MYYYNITFCAIIRVHSYLSLTAFRLLHPLWDCKNYNKQKGLFDIGKIDQHIEIVSSTVPGWSSMSAVSRNAAADTLRRRYSRVGITIVNNLADLEALVAKAPDLVLLGMKYIVSDPQPDSATGETIWLADYLSERDIATTGSQSMAHRLELDKALAKQSVLDAGFSSSAFYVASVGQPLDAGRLPGDYPLFVKPVNLGGGAGIDSDSVVNNLGELQSKVDSIAFTLGADSLIEEYLPGREFSVGILWDDEQNYFVGMPLELIAPQNEHGARLLSNQVKSADAEQAIAVTDSKLHQSLIDLAVGAFQSIGGRDYGRVDIRMDSSGTLHFLEANLIPSLIENYGSFPKACALNRAIGYEEMLLQIVELAMSRAACTGELPLLAPRQDIVHSLSL